MLGFACAALTIASVTALPQYAVLSLPLGKKFHFLGPVPLRMFSDVGEESVGHVVTSCKTLLFCIFLLH